jgi:hypothetical protein
MNRIISFEEIHGALKNPPSLNLRPNFLKIRALREFIYNVPGILANKRLRRKLAPFGYYEHTKTPGLWYHESRPISFTLVVDDFGVKYVDKADADHLTKSIRSTYTVTKDWTGDLYCGISLTWDYDGRTVARICQKETARIEACC